MIVITYNGGLINFLPILPVCSWFYKEKNEKILFILDNSFQFIDEVLRLQPFVSDIIFTDVINSKYLIDNVYDPRKSDLSIKYSFDELYMFNDEQFSTINENISKYYAYQMNGEFDKDFVLNLNLNFRYHTENISTITQLKQIFPYYIDESNSSLLVTLQNLAYGQERHLPHSYITLLLSYAGSFIYLYLSDNLQNNNPFSIYWGYYAKAPIIDVREIKDGEMRSIYNKIYFI